MFNAKKSDLPINTYTIGYADETTMKLETQDWFQKLEPITRVIRSPKDLLATVPKIADIYDEPFADLSEDQPV